jgi:DNA gyrase subunit A
VIAQQCSDRNGNLVGAIQVGSGEEMMLISDQGKLVRTRVDEVSHSGRNTQGVTLIRLKDGEHLVGIERVDESDDDVIQDSAPDGAAQPAESAQDETPRRDDDGVDDGDD